MPRDEEEIIEPDALVPVVLPLPSIEGIEPPSIQPESYRAFPNDVTDDDVMGDVGQARIDHSRRERLKAGTYDAFLGKVLATGTQGDGPADIGSLQAINAERIDVRWDATTNKPLSSVTPSPMGGSTNIVACRPWPPTHDQKTHLVAEGDIVTIIRGADGLSYFMYDNTPFIGVVVAWDDDDVTEEFSGGAMSWDNNRGIVVRQQEFDNQSSTQRAWLEEMTDLETVADAWDAAVTYKVDDVALDTDTKTYRSLQGSNINHDPSATVGVWWEEDNIVIRRYVNVVSQENQHHGYRVGDKVVVFRRGLYLFCMPLRATILARTNVSATAAPNGPGPDGEADFTDEHYWVQEVDSTITYATNAWTFAGQPTPRSATDPTGSGGRKGIWVDAVNLYEKTDATHLLADNILVEVSMWLDTTNGEPFYTFDHVPPLSVLPEAYKVRVSANDTTPAYLADKVEGDGSWISGGEITDGGNEDWRLSHIGPGQSFYTGIGGIDAIDIDGLGHVRTFTPSGGSPTGPCA